MLIAHLPSGYLPGRAVGARGGRMAAALRILAVARVRYLCEIVIILAAIILWRRRRVATARTAR